MSHESNEKRYSRYYANSEVTHGGAKRALASEICGSDDNLLRDRRPTLRRRVRKFLKDAAMKLRLL